MALQGIKISNNFKQTQVEFDLMIRHMNDITSKPININVNINSVQQQIKQASQQISEISKTAQNSIAESVPNTDKLSKALEQAQRGLSINLQGLKTKYGSLLPDEEITRLENSIKNLDATDMGTLRTSVKDVRLDMSQMTANAKDSSSALRIANQDAKSFGATLASDATKFGLWMVIGTMIMQPIRAIQEGIASVKELDDTLNDLQMDMMNTSKDAFDNLVVSSRNLSISLGTNIKDIDEMMKVYSNANTSVDEIMKKTGAAAILTNISDMSAKDSVDAIQSIMLQFDQFKNSTDNLSDQANHINDVLSSVAQGLNTDFKTGIQNISEAVKVSGEVINEAGMSYEKYASIVGKVAEVSRLSGSTIGNAMKTIASRIGRANTGEVSAEEVSAIDKAYQSIGINIRKSNGEFEDLDTTLSSLSKVWSNLNNVERSYIAEQSAGVRQKSIFINMMNNYAQTTQMATEALNNQGLSSQKNAIYLDSLTAKITILKNELTAMWQNGINSNIFKGMLDGAISLVQTFGNLRNIVVLTATGLALFKGVEILNFFKTLPNNIASTVRSMEVFKVAIGALKMQEEGLITTSEVASLTFKTLGTSIKTAFLSNPLGWIAIGITGVITAMDLFGQSAEKTKQEIKDLTNQMNTLNQNSKLVDNYKNLQEQLDKTNKTAPEYVNLQNQILDVQKQLAQAMPSLVDGYTKEGDAIVQNTKALDDYIAKKRTSILAEAGSKYNNIYGELTDKKMGNDINSKWYDDLLGAFSDRSLGQKSRSLIDQYSEAINKANELVGKGNLKEASKYADTANKIEEKIRQLNEASIQLYSIGMKDVEFYDIASGKMIKYSDYLAESASKTKAETDSIKDNTNAKTKAQSSMKSLNDIEKELADTLASSRGDIDEINKTLEQHAKTGEWNYDTIIKLAKDYPSLLAKLNDEKGLEQELIKIKGDKVNAVQQSLNAQIKLEVDYINELTSGYNFDIRNFKSAQEAKDALVKAGVNKRIQMYRDEMEAAGKALSASSGAASINDLSTFLTMANRFSTASLQSTSVNTAIDEYFQLKTLSSNVGSLLNNAGSSNYDGKSNGKAEDAAKKAEELLNQMKDNVKDVESSITEIYKKEYEKRKQLDDDLYNKKKENLQKEKDLYNKQNSEDDYQKNLNKEKETLNGINASIVNARRDTSLAGQMRLKDLLEQAKTQQEKIDDLVLSHTRDTNNQLFDDKLTQLDKEKEASDKALAEQYSDENIAKMVNSSIVSGEFKDMNGGIISVLDAYKNFQNTYNDGLTASGQIMQSQFIDKWSKVRELINGTSGVNIGVNFNSLPKYDVGTPLLLSDQIAHVHKDEAIIPAEMNPFRGSKYLNNFMNMILPRTSNISSIKSRTPVINFNQPLLNVTGGISSELDFNKMVKTLKNEVLGQIVQVYNDDGVYTHA